MLTSSVMIWKTLELSTLKMDLYLLKKGKREFDRFEYKAHKEDLKERIKRLKQELKRG